MWIKPDITVRASMYTHTHYWNWERKFLSPQGGEIIELPSLWPACTNRAVHRYTPLHTNTAMQMTRNHKCSRIGLGNKNTSNVFRILNSVGCITFTPGYFKTWTVDHGLDYGLDYGYVQDHTSTWRKSQDSEMHAGEGNRVWSIVQSKVQSTVHGPGLEVSLHAHMYIDEHPCTSSRPIQHLLIQTSEPDMYTILWVCGRRQDTWNAYISQ